jgi:hypothetical protein
MSWRSYFLLFLIGLIGPIFISRFQYAPGYMDADYYFAGGIRLSEGYGFSEMFLWNFLDNPTGLPHPSHGYWMPLVAILSAAGMKVIGEPNFSSGRLVFLFLAAMIPPLTAGLAMRLHHRRDFALLAGLLAVFPGFYLPYLSTTDIFGPYMILGILFLLILPWGNFVETPASNYSFIRFFLLGLTAGLMHLGRADGVIWVFLALSMVIFLCVRNPDRKERMRDVLAIFIGYLLVMGPWYLRNIVVFGSPFPQGGARALWILSYDELFTYPASRLTFQRWWDAGVIELARDRAWAMGLNLQTTLGVQGEIFLAPLILIGLWQMRKNHLIWLAGSGWMLTFLVMTMIFPFQGARGGFFHSGAVFQPLFWAVAPLGLESTLKWGARKRGWSLKSARLFFSSGLIGLALLLTFLVSYNRLFDSQTGRLTWNDGFDLYARLDSFLMDKGASPDNIVMVNNSPGYYVSTNRPAISIPYSVLNELCNAAQRYHVRYLLLEIDQIPGKSDLYNDPGDQLCLQFVDTFEGVRIYNITGP